MKRRNLIILLINILTLTSCMRADACIAYFYSFDEESSFRYVQVSKKYLGYTVDEYHYKEGKYDGDIEININIPNEINGVPVTSMGNSSYRLKKQYINIMIVRTLVILHALCNLRLLQMIFLVKIVI